MASRTTDTGKTLTPVGRAEQHATEIIKVDEKARRAWSMRQNGATYYQIAEELKISEGAAAKTVRQVAEHMADLVDVGAKQNLLMLELDSLSRLQSTYFPLAEAGDLRALDGVLRIMAHRAKLAGLDQVQVDNRKQTVVIAGDNDDYIAAIGRAMGGDQ